MPKRNGTGPRGRGPLTGRRMGPGGNENELNSFPGQTQNLRRRIMNGFGNMFGWKRGRSKGIQRPGQGRRGGRGSIKNR
jgi:hypothetical protein